MMIRTEIERELMVLAWKMEELYKAYNPGAGQVLVSIGDNGMMIRDSLTDDDGKCIGSTFEIFEHGGRTTVTESLDVVDGIAYRDGLKVGKVASR